MDESFSQKKNEFDFGEPGAEPMAGIEKFTINPAPNPISPKQKNAQKLWQALIEQMRQEIERKAEGKTRQEFSIQERNVLKQGLYPNVEKDGTVSMMLSTVSQWQGIEIISQALADEVWNSCGNDMGICVSVLDRFAIKISTDEFRPPELMSTLLVCIEEVKGEYPDKPNVGGNKPLHFSSPLIAYTIPEDGKPQPPLIEPINIRLVSIREMLRRYFEKYPREYRLALAKVMARNIGEISSPEILKQAIEQEINRMGVWEFSLRVWNEVRKNSGEKKQKESLDYGILPPLEKVGEKEWKISPRWAGKEEKEEIAIIAKIIAEQLSLG